ncbi:MAG: type II secretion system GspH family protein [Candidatus Pacebacteria bacterium]|nr:type II secretion system GspH family protein [Candidatus Paceibacterota bacterium]
MKDRPSDAQMTCVVHRFTLTEVLVVMVVIAILLAIAIGTTRLAWHKAENAHIRANMKKLELALDQYKRDWGYYPQQSSLTDLNFDLKSPSGDDYLDESTKPYRQSGEGSEPFRYECPGTHNTQKYDLQAPGVDGDPATADDNITNWERN